MTPDEVKRLADAYADECAAPTDSDPGCRYRLRRQIHSAIDALAAQTAVPAAVTRINIPTETMEQEFQGHYSRGYKAGVAASTPVVPAQPVAWQPIETAPKNNRRPLYLARFDECGKLSEIAFNGGWEFWQESYEMPDVCGYDWVSDGGIENPTHWAYQTTADGLSTVAPPTERGPSSSSQEKDL